MLYEDIGLAAPGEASKLLWAGETTLGGRVPVNTSGGLISKGHPVGASGCAQPVELTEQLRGQAGDRQVHRAGRERRRVPRRRRGRLLRDDPRGSILEVV